MRQNRPIHVFTAKIDFLWWWDKMFLHIHPVENAPPAYTEYGKLVEAGEVLDDSNTSSYIDLANVIVGQVLHNEWQGESANTLPPPLLWRCVSMETRRRPA